MGKITPFLWYDDKAEEAANFYVSIFKNSKVGKVTRYEEESAKATGRPANTAMTLEFEIDGQKFVALNGGPHFKFTEAVSFVVNCENQEEVDYFWDKLTAGGGSESMCAWLKGQVRFVMADRPHHFARAAAKQRREEITPGHDGNDANEKD